MLVLVVEDDQDYAEIIAHTLRRDSHDVVLVNSCSAAWRFIQQKPPALAVLDIVLPDGSGLDMAQTLRHSLPTLPIMFLSSLDRPADVTAGFNSGGDDYIVKPFHPSVLLARVRAVARRSGRPGVVERPASTAVEAMGIRLEPGNQAAYFHGVNLNLSRLECEIMGQLMLYPRKALSHAFLSEAVWGYRNMNDATLLKNHVCSIRRKLRHAGVEVELIRTVQHVGYSFVAI
ncbi:hypothetical protein AYO38_07650 [bacterium SCGC AG-212-C10]|nr:hypothetical protein AYO38_07650 [bacterium SCGC AG-212-C10]